MYITTVTIADSASLSGASATPDGGGELILMGFQTDSAWDTNAVTFQGLVPGGSFANVFGDTAEYSIAGVVASTFYAVDPLKFTAFESIKVRSGTSGSAVNQSGATVITLVFGW